MWAPALKDVKPFQRRNLHGFAPINSSLSLCLVHKAGYGCLLVYTSDGLPQCLLLLLVCCFSARSWAEVQQQENKDGGHQ